MSKVFLIDVAKCTGCYNCQLACKDEHCGNDWRPYAAPQPLTGQFWCRVTERVQGSIPKVKIHYIAQMCAHCANPRCMAACLHGAFSRREDGFILINPDACVGCGFCVSACPYGAIYFNRENHIAQKCTGCAHLLDNGVSAKPRCVDACPTDALVFGEESELKEQLVGAKPLSPGGKLYYKNIPGEFIGGTVYDPVEKEVVIGAKCVLSGEGKTYETETDSYGDFWFKNLPAGGSYDLTISAAGFREKRFEKISVKKSVNLDDIPMERA